MLGFQHREIRVFLRSYVERASVLGERGRESVRGRRWKIGGVQSSTYKQFQLHRGRQDQRWPQGQWYGSGDDGVRICRARTGVELHAC